MEPNSNEAKIPRAFEITFDHSAQYATLSFGMFTHCGTVCRGWRDAVDAAHRMLVHLDFRGHEASVTVVSCFVR